MYRHLKVGDYQVWRGSPKLWSWVSASINTVCYFPYQLKATRVKWESGFERSEKMTISRVLYFLHYPPHATFTCIQFSFYWLHVTFPNTTLMYNSLSLLCYYSALSMCIQLFIGSVLLLALSMCIQLNWFCVLSSKHSMIIQLFIGSALFFQHTTCI